MYYEGVQFCRSTKHTYSVSDTEKKQKRTIKQTDRLTIIEFRTEMRN